MSDTAIDNLDWVEGTPNAPGIKSVVYGAPKRWIEAWPAIGADEVTYEGSFTMVEGQTFKRIGVADEKSPVDGEGQGERFNETVLNKANIVTPLTNKKATAFATQANRDDMVYLVEEKGQSGTYRVVGHPDFRTTTKPSIKLGDSSTSEKSTTLVAECTDFVLLPFYEGSIETDEGILNQP